MSEERQESVADIVAEKCAFCKRKLKRGERRICRRCAELVPGIVKVADRKPYTEGENEK